MGIAAWGVGGRGTMSNVTGVFVDPLDRIDEVIALVEAARSMPMSRNCIVDRGEMIAILDQLRSELPAEMRRASALLDERDKILDAGKREADRIIGHAEDEHA